MLKDADPKYFAGIYIVCGYTDLRYGIDSLAAIIERKYHANMFVPNTLFLFCGRSASKIKGLLWEGDGFLLLYKRVESGHFSWPRSSDELRSMTPEQFRLLMQGFAIDPIIHDVIPRHSARSILFFLYKTENFYSCFLHLFQGAVHSFRRLRYRIAASLQSSAQHFSFLFSSLI